MLILFLQIFARTPLLNENWKYEVEKRQCALSVSRMKKKKSKIFQFLLASIDDTWWR